MKQGYTKVALLLDRSGSMEAIRDAMIECVNGFVKGLQKQEGECDVLAVQFDSQNPYEILFYKPLMTVPELTRAQYQPRGGTPLFDAMGMLITTLGNELGALQEHQRPEHVIVAIVTDGYENASHRFSKAAIKDMVIEQTETWKWAFTFFGANQDALFAAQEMGIDPVYAVNFAGHVNTTPVVSQSAALFSNTIRSGSSAPVAAASSYTAATRSAAMDTSVNWGSLQEQKSDQTGAAPTHTQVKTENTTSPSATVNQ